MVHPDQSGSTYPTNRVTHNELRSGSSEERCTGADLGRPPDGGASSQRPTRRARSPAVSMNAFCGCAHLSVCATGMVPNILPHGQCYRGFRAPDWHWARPRRPEVEFNSHSHRQFAKLVSGFSAKPLRGRRFLLRDRFVPPKIHRDFEPGLYPPLAVPTNHASTVDLRRIVDLGSVNKAGCCGQRSLGLSWAVVSQTQCLVLLVFQVKGPYLPAFGARSSAVEHLTFNQVVVGSIPTGLTT